MRVTFLIQSKDVSYSKSFRIILEIDMSQIQQMKKEKKRKENRQKITKIGKNLLSLKFYCYLYIHVNKNEFSHKIKTTHLRPNIKKKKNSKQII